MYTVIEKSIDSSVEKVIFRSALESQCWSLISNYLSSSDSNVRQRGLNFAVVNKLWEFVDAPELIKTLRKIVQNEEIKVA